MFNKKPEETREEVKKVFGEDFANTFYQKGETEEQKAKRWLNQKYPGISRDIKSTGNPGK